MRVAFGMGLGYEKTLVWKVKEEHFRVVCSRRGCVAIKREYHFGKGGGDKKFSLIKVTGTDVGDRGRKECMSNERKI